MDEILIIDGVVKQIWRGGRKKWDNKLPKEGEIVSADGAVPGMLWDGSKLSTAPPEAVSPTANDVRAEASRRIQVLVGARDADHLAIKISNAARAGVRLLSIGEANWDAAQKAESDYLKQADAAIELIRARSNDLEAMDPIPDDYKDNKYWT
jgi:hypothetical protein